MVTSSGLNSKKYVGVKNTSSMDYEQPLGVSFYNFSEKRNYLCGLNRYLRLC
jgi:hypothetical protein